MTPTSRKLRMQAEGCIKGGDRYWADKLLKHARKLEDAQAKRYADKLARSKSARYQAAVR